MTRVLRVLSHIGEGILQPAKDAYPDATFTVIPQDGPIDPDLRGNALLTFTWGAPNMAEAMSRGIEWVHTFGTGVDGYPFETLGEAQLSCSRGASAIPIAEWVIANLLAFEKQLPQSWIEAPPEHWNRASLGGLHGRTLALLGFGGIAQRVAQHALGFGMKVRALRRSPGPSPLAGVEMVSDLNALVTDADHLVVAAPSTPATHHIVGADLLKQVKPGLHLVNIARGSLVDQDALRAALEDGRVAIASLDTVDPEPLPDGHWLFSHPQVRLSAHISWSGPGSFDGLLAPFVENLGHFQRGEGLSNLVDPAERY